MPAGHCKQALSITGFLIFIVLSGNLITARVNYMKTDGAVPDDNTTNGNGTGHQSKLAIPTDMDLQYLEGAGHELTDMDYTPVRNKPPIHN
ncbi:hypothetical protein MKW94_025633 [Papaver nudicaule]|uniref:Uncharacterized protein n=1 Tax=Papaver nudicaule TaxID=74823 RepID=A0AA41RSD3_PAPNU|nr:hypothetical protein [Papaver nudicaule]